MASMYGVQIKGLKKRKGDEGQTAFQGNVYKNGKKLGFWSQSTCGRADTFDFDEEALHDEIVKFANREKQESVSATGMLYANFLGAADFMSALCSLMEYEKRYKEALKKGYSVLTIIESTYAVNSTAPLSEEKIDEYKKAKAYSVASGKVRVFASLNGFIIT